MSSEKKHSSPFDGHKRQIRRVLESGTLEQLINSKKSSELITIYHGDIYWEFVQKRFQIQDKIYKSLHEASKREYPIKNWQRAVRYEYSLHPLSATGSLIDPGGRFNIGELNPIIKSFPALYIAENKETAIQEIFGEPESKNRFTGLELSLNKKDSITFVRLNGFLEKYIDLFDPNSLKKFVSLIKEFKHSKELQEKAKKLKLESPKAVSSVEELIRHLLDPDWKTLPAIYDIPANSQIFGQLIYLSGIEGILYPSKYTSLPCLTIFPENFRLSEKSFLEISDKTPHKNTPKRLDKENWKICLESFNDKKTAGFL